MRKAFLNKKCHKCDADLVCPSCGTVSPSGTNFSNWIRAQPINHSIQDVDFVVHDYVNNHIITLEEKCYGAKPNKAQMDTQVILFQMLKNANGMIVNTIRGKRPVKYRGHHVVSFEKTSPDDSEWVKIDGRRYDVDALYSLIDTLSLE